MANLSQLDVKLFKTLASATENELHRAILDYLSNKYSNIVNTEDYIYAVGDIPVALVAHMDTVFSTPPKNIYYDRDYGVFWSPNGLGADDRAGIFIIMKILQTTDLRPSIILTHGEEMGDIGAEKLVADIPHPKSNINYIIEVDRCGTNDCVFYNCANSDFIAYIESFGFLENFGSFTDISAICPAWGIAGVNLSVGYEDEHTYAEMLYTTPLMATFEKIKTLLRQDTIPSFKYIVSPASNIIKFSDEICDGCGSIFHDYELTDVIGKNGDIKHFCSACCCSNNNINWCEGCSQIFECENPNEDKFCYRCRKVNNEDGI